EDPEQGTREKLRGPPAWPGEVVVPRSLVELIRRGLAPQPADRWPSMDALLARLERVRPGRPRGGSARRALGVAVVTSGVAGLWLWHEAEGASRCTGAQERLATVWDAERAEAVRRGLEAAGAVHLEETWPRVEQRLDAYAEHWVAAHTEACEATTVRAEVGPGVLDDRMACLERARVELRSLVGLLSDPGAELASQAVALAAGLPLPARCMEAPAAQGELPLPADPALAAQSTALREALTEVKALQLARKYDEALARVEPLIERAHASGDGALEGVGLFRRGLLHSLRGEQEAAEADLLRAHSLAVEHGYPRLVQQAASQLAFVVGHRQARPVEGLRWANAGVAEAQRVAPGGMLEADARDSLAVVLHMQGRYDEAVAEQRRSLELWQQAVLDGEADELDVAGATDALGNLVMEQGRAEEAVQLHRRVLELRERMLGPSHLDVANSLNNLGSALMAQDRTDEALGLLQRALAIREQVLGPDAPALVSVLVNLGGLLSDQGRPRDAQPYLERGLAIARARLGEDHPYVGSALVNLGAVHRELGELEEARRYFELCRVTWERSLGADHPKIALVLSSLAELDRDAGRLDQAEPRYER
ncbi:MAG: tetratricopeptide repeat protein, partial [Myxococcales bacterium]|nr:tetratricopeptide repeat protein [Myxococcales bacterium]